MREHSPQGKESSLEATIVPLESANVMYWSLKPFEPQPAVAQSAIRRVTPAGAVNTQGTVLVVALSVMEAEYEAHLTNIPISLIVDGTGVGLLGERVGIAVGLRILEIGIRVGFKKGIIDGIAAKGTTTPDTTN
jgi:hypothetical protein